MHNEKEWYSSWFDSPYYHSLYSHRNHQEAADFVSRLIDLIEPAKDAHILDIACGRGRHALELYRHCLLYTSPSPRDLSTSRMPSSA